MVRSELLVVGRAACCLLVVDCFALFVVVFCSLLFIAFVVCAVFVLPISLRVVCCLL